MGKGVKISDNRKDTGVNERCRRLRRVYDKAGKGMILQVALPYEDPITRAPCNLGHPLANTFGIYLYEHWSGSAEASM